MNSVELIIENELAILKVTRPKALNALNKEVLMEIDECITRVQGEKRLRCMIITGEGDKAFVAGADIKEIDQLDEKTALEFAQKGQSIFRRLEKLKFPVIAAVNGFALGGGLELALSCDFIMASGNAQFGLPECTLGLIPGFGGTVRLARRIGPHLAKEMSFSGNFYSAEDAYRIGLVSRVVEREQLLPEAKKMAQTFAKRAPLALAGIKSSIDRGMDCGVDKALEIEAQIFSKLFNSKDREEGTKAFIEKRSPNFVGE